MRKQILMALLLLSFMGVQRAIAQSATTPSVDPPQHANVAYGGPAMAAAADAVAVNASADPATTGAVQPQQDDVNSKMNSANKKKTKRPSQESDNKSPYWEPRDWTYIYNQGP